MHVPRSVLAVLALAVFVAGGLVAPVVHHGTHGQEWDDARAAIAVQTEHVHEEAPGWTHGLDTHFDAACCWLCAPLVYQPTLAPPAAVAPVLAPKLAAEGAPFLLDRAPEVASSRGPPALA